MSDRPKPDNRWKLVVVVGGLAAAVIIGAVLTLGSTSSTSSTGPVAANAVWGGDLGVVDTEQALRAKLEPAIGGASRSTATQHIPRNGCLDVARKLQPQGAVLAYVATARWQETPAEVFGFNPPGAPATTSPGRPAPTRVYVLARADCHLLVFQSFSP